MWSSKQQTFERCIRLNKHGPAFRKHGRLRGHSKPPTQKKNSRIKSDCFYVKESKWGSLYLAAATHFIWLFRRLYAFLRNMWWCLKTLLWHQFQFRHIPAASGAVRWGYLAYLAAFEVYKCCTTFEYGMGYGSKNVQIFLVGSTWDGGVRLVCKQMSRLPAMSTARKTLWLKWFEMQKVLCTANVEQKRLVVELKDPARSVLSKKEVSREVMSHLVKGLLEGNHFCSPRWCHCKCKEKIWCYDAVSFSCFFSFPFDLLPSPFYFMLFSFSSFSSFHLFHFSSVCFVPSFHFFPMPLTFFLLSFHFLSLPLPSFQLSMFLAAHSFGGMRFHCLHLIWILPGISCRDRSSRRRKMCGGCCCDRLISNTVRERVTLGARIRWFAVRGLSVPEKNVAAAV